MAGSGKNISIPESIWCWSQGKVLKSIKLTYDEPQNGKQIFFVDALIAILPNNPPIFATKIVKTAEILINKYSNQCQVNSHIKSVKLSGAAFKKPRKWLCVKKALNTTSSLAGRPVAWAANDCSASGTIDMVVVYPISQQLGKQWHIYDPFVLIANARSTSAMQSWWTFPQIMVALSICGTKYIVQLHTALNRLPLHSLKQFYGFQDMNFNWPKNILWGKDRAYLSRVCAAAW